MKNELIKPELLQIDLERAESSGDIRMLILYANLYNEYFVNLLYDLSFKEDKFERCKECSKPLVPKFKQQVKKLTVVGVISGENGHDNMINLIFDLRNEIAHNLRLDMSALNKRFDEQHKPHMEDPLGIITKFLKTVTIQEKIKLAVFATVTNLYQEYEKLNKRIPKQTISYRINSEGTAVQIVIEPYIS